MPELIIIAGCNGAGKSTFASSFISENISSFDYDKLYLEYYNSLPDSEFREKFAKDKTTKEFEQAVKSSIDLGLDFATRQTLIAYQFIGLKYLSEKDSR